LTCLLPAPSAKRAALGTVLLKFALPASARPINSGNRTPVPARAQAKPIHVVHGFQLNDLRFFFSDRGDSS